MKHFGAGCQNSLFENLSFLNTQNRSQKFTLFSRNSIHAAKFCNLEIWRKPSSFSDGKGEFGADVNIWFVLVNADHFKGTQYSKAPGVTRVDGFDCAGEEGIATVRSLFCSKKCSNIKGVF